MQNAVTYWMYISLDLQKSYCHDLDPLLTNIEEEFKFEYITHVAFDNCYACVVNCTTPVTDRIGEKSFLCAMIDGGSLIIYCWLEFVYNKTTRQ